MNSILLGAFGEQNAARFLREDGYEIWSANYKTYAGEIDIVAQKDGVICFIEVKTRQTGGMFAPAEAVGFKKRGNIKRCAASYMNRYNLKNKTRYDIIEVLVNDSSVSEINHIKNAF